MYFCFGVLTNKINNTPYAIWKSCKDYPHKLRQTPKQLFTLWPHATMNIIIISSPLPKFQLNWKLSLTNYPFPIPFISSFSSKPSHQFQSAPNPTLESSLKSNPKSQKSLNKESITISRASRKHLNQYFFIHSWVAQLQDPTPFPPETTIITTHKTTLLILILWHQQQIHLLLLQIHQEQLALLNLSHYKLKLHWSITRLREKVTLTILSL